MIWAIDLNQKFKGSEFLRGVTLVRLDHSRYSHRLLMELDLQWSVWHPQQHLNEAGHPGYRHRMAGTDQYSTVMCVIIARTWQMLPWYMASLLGGLNSVSLDQVEAAHIDGAGNWKTFWHIILPGMKQTAVLVFILGVIGNLQHFDLPWTMTQGGPARATTTLSIEVFTTAFKNWDMGKAATVGTIWAILLACFSILYIRKINDADD
jgi:multiple sugar transport system permease protein